MDLWLKKNVWDRLDDQLESKPEDLLLAADWLDFLNLSPFLQKKLHHLILTVRAMREEATIYPPENQIMAWSFMCPPQDVKVVILGQDPYHRGQATGLAFSVKPSDPIPPSLKNIYSELLVSVSGFRSPTHGCLNSWGFNGVLLLNTILTVEEGKPASHADLGWQWFTNYVITSLSENLKHCVFMLWGSKAIDKARLINAKNHLVLKAQHPSPLAQCSHRTSNWPKFLGCNHFNLANKYLAENNRGTIDWSLN
ncbi:uracil-DNA glycosylase [Common bottlenose dolphin gammaherpesvirus 1 strain Sarasota]|uniref:Uracil-DNA glycosylase n=1 Tax=Common bottlenose dolphin gammaherpesvirus 1 strain Sarasota TaxID=2022783 RepID=A0A1Z1NEA5_9GAMA|nr:uracil-DNA glycosylase [Common bottlenose dolphin gammaherpesvirus 1 strain Sarasota]ARW78108.1 uracil-DNA glycosylase [Common bottlenose dolphin gammaherpesvirus 1 strain Sarasota]